MNAANPSAERAGPAPKRRGRRVIATLAALILAGVFDGWSGSTPPLPLATVDLDRMYGGWYLIATIPNIVEKGIVEPYDVYSRRPDGDIAEDFFMRRGGFDASRQHFRVHDWVREGTGNAHWRVQIVWPINLPFLVLYVDPAYRFVIFGENNRALGWIYARRQVIGEADYAAMTARLREVGYDPAAFKRFVQRPEQWGQPGFWSEGVAPPAG